MGIKQDLFARFERKPKFTTGQVVKHSDANQLICLTHIQVDDNCDTHSYRYMYKGYNESNIMSDWVPEDRLELLKSNLKAVGEQFEFGRALVYAKKSDLEAVGEQFDFGQALAYIKKGNKLARQNWNGKGMFIFLVPGFTFKAPPLLGIYPEGTEIKYHTHVAAKTADGQVVPWLARQTDILADDWSIVS